MRRRTLGGGDSAAWVAALTVLKLSNNKTLHRKEVERGINE
jgi:hypothetical protein